MQPRVSKELFCAWMKKIQECWDYDEECCNLARKYNIDFHAPSVSELAGVAIDAICRLFPNSVEDICYFCFDIGFGRKWEPGCVVDVRKEGEKIELDFSSAEKLYDYIISKQGE